jgi:hypothetical protein
MDPRHVSAERLPELYRAILDAVVELERRGARREAADTRRSQPRAYRVWDAKAERRLLRLHAEAMRLLDDPAHDVHRRAWTSRLGGVKPGRTGPAGGPVDSIVERAPSA